MTAKVPAEQIEQIVGAPRDRTEHLGRAVSAEQTVYILHSRECRDSTPDLRDCPYSLALDRGARGWRRILDRPVRVQIFRGFLVPALSEVMRAP